MTVTISVNATPLTAVVTVLLATVTLDQASRTLSANVQELLDSE